MRSKAYMSQINLQHGTTAVRGEQEEWKTKEWKRTRYCKCVVPKKSLAFCKLYVCRKSIVTLALAYDHRKIVVRYFVNQAPIFFLDTVWFQQSASFDQRIQSRWCCRVLHSFIFFNGMAIDRCFTTRLAMFWRFVTFKLHLHLRISIRWQKNNS